MTMSIGEKSGLAHKNNSRSFAKFAITNTQQPYPFQSSNKSHTIRWTKKRITNHANLRKLENWKREIFMDVVYKEESYKIIGVGFEVYNEKSFGFHEPVYQECMELELGFQSIPFQPQQELGLEYKGHLLKQKYIPE